MLIMLIKCALFAPQVEEFSELLVELEGFEDAGELEHETIRTKAKWAETYPRIFPNVPVSIGQLTLHDITNHQRENQQNRKTKSEIQSSKGTRWEFFLAWFLIFIDILVEFICFSTVNRE